MTPAFVSAGIGFLLTLMVLSYWIGDGPFFRFAVHLFVGVSAGYVVVVAWHQVLLPDLLLPLVNPATPVMARGLLLIPLGLSGLLMAKLSPRFSRWGTPAAAYLVGVSAAVVVGGAVLGTILPQISAAAEPFDLRDPLNSLNGAIALLAAVSTLAYFHFGARRQPDGTVKRFGLLESLAWLGELFLALTLGALFAGVYSAALTALVERVDSVLAYIFSLLGSL